MLRLLSLSTRYPNKARPQYGNFVERQNVALAARAGVEVEVLAPVLLPPFPLSLRYPALRAVPACEERGGLRVHHPRATYVPGAPRLTPALLARALLPAVRRIHRTFPFDLIHAEWFWPEAPAAMRLARALGIPFTAKARGRDIETFGLEPALRRVMAEAASEARALLAVSASLRDSMAAMGLPRERILIHEPGLDRDLFRPLDREAARAAIGAETPLLLAVGNLASGKGQDLAIHALARIGRGTLLLAGSGPEAPRLAALAAQLGVSGRVRFLGSVAHALLPRFYNAAEILLHLSAQEGAGNVRLEALACGTPVVTTAVGDVASVIGRAQGSGRIVPPDPGAAAAAVREILAAPPPPEAVRRATARFSWERNAAELEDILRAAARAGRDRA
ncbi:MAG: teichuronic acid biosynthesis glycosyltransferase TuaC [Sphingomonadales bacterium]|jgi:glycosyltransferase involved in cell wall biosynthesis|nr:teichuronic acid biosynthesis glycosyltransferase TuaC [Sphingomonadales bacterium]